MFAVVFPVSPQAFFPIHPWVYRWCMLPHLPNPWGIEFRSVGLTVNSQGGLTQSLGWDSWWDPWGCLQHGQNLDTMIPLAPFQLGIFCDSMIISCNNQPSGNIKPLTFTHPSHSTPFLGMWKTFLNLREQHPPSKLLSSLLGAIKEPPGVQWQDERSL